MKAPGSSEHDRGAFAVRGALLADPRLGRRTTGGFALYPRTSEQLCLLAKSALIKVPASNASSRFNTRFPPRITTKKVNSQEATLASPNFHKHIPQQICVGLSLPKQRAACGEPKADNSAQMLAYGGGYQRTGYGAQGGDDGGGFMAGSQQGSQGGGGGGGSKVNPSPYKPTLTPKQNTPR